MTTSSRHHSTFRLIMWSQKLVTLSIFVFVFLPMCISFSICVCLSKLLPRAKVFPPGLSPVVSQSSDCQSIQISVFSNIAQQQSFRCSYVFVQITTNPWMCVTVCRLISSCASTLTRRTVFYLGERRQMVISC